MGIEYLRCSCFIKHFCLFVFVVVAVVVVLGILSNFGFCKCWYEKFRYSLFSYCQFLISPIDIFISSVVLFKIIAIHNGFLLVVRQWILFIEICPGWWFGYITLIHSHTSSPQSKNSLSACHVSCNYCLLPWKICEEISRQSTLFHN